jgi:hypothetical protein
MRFTRLIAGLTTAGLLGLAPVALSAPASADGQTYTPVITAEINEMGSPYEPPYKYGQEFYVSGKITDASGIEGPSGGQALLQIMTPSNPVWTTIATDDSPSYLFFDAGFRFSSNAQLKVVFTGSTALGSWDDSYVAGESAIMSAPVTRNVVLKNPRGTLIKGKVTPDYNRKPITVKKLVGKKWKKYKTFKTSRAGKYGFKLPAPRRGKWKWMITVKGDANFVAWSTVGTTYSYRTAAPRLSVQ